MVNSLYLDPVKEEELNQKLVVKYEKMRQNEVMYEEYNTDKPYKVLLVAYGTTARVCKTAIKKLAEEGIHAALLRPITLYPYPSDRLYELSRPVEFLMSVEMSCGQMVEDVELGVKCERPVYFYGRQGGLVPTPEEVVDEVRKRLGKGA